MERTALLGAAQPTIQGHGGKGGKGAESLNGVMQTTLLIVANIAGAGILSLPLAISGVGVAAGTAMVVFAAVLSTYTADILSRCFGLIKRREQERGMTGGGGGGKRGGDGQSSFFARSPYACIGQEAAGSVGAAAVTFAQFTTLFSVMVVFFLVCGLNISALVPAHSPLFYSLVCTAALTPLMLLRPSHVWGTALIAIIATSILVVVILVLCATDAPHKQRTPLPTVTFPTLGTSFGVIIFGYGGHAILPALQATMADPTPARFRRAIIMSFAICTFIYLSTAIASVARLGGAVEGNVLLSFHSHGPRGWLSTFGLVSVTAHLLFATTIVHIPVGQILDHYCGATDLSARQVGIRVTTMMMVALVIKLAGTHFFCVIGLVGGTCSCAMIFIFPPWFYLMLLDAEQRTVGLTCRMIAIIAIGFTGMVSALNGAVDSCK